MIRYATVNGNAVQVLEGTLHDAVSAGHVWAALARLDPPEVAVDAPHWTWNSLQKGRSRIDPVEDEVCRAIEGRSGVQSYALYTTLQQWASTEGRRVRLLSGISRPAGRALRPLVKALRREGIDAKTPYGAADELRNQYLPRFPAMQDWYAARSARIVRDVQRTFAASGGVCVLTYPDGPIVGDLAQRDGWAIPSEAMEGPGAAGREDWSLADMPVEGPATVIRRV